jgi:signal transduction histidine kinase
VLVLLASALVTAFAMVQMRAVEDEEAFANFSQNARRLVRDIELRLGDLMQLASGGAGLLNSGVVPGTAGWTAYTGVLQTAGHGSGLQGLGVAYRDATPELAEGRFPIAYLAPPSAANQNAVGLDVAADPLFAAAIGLARDRGEPTFSGVGKTVLNGDASRPIAILFAPFYRGGRPDTIDARRQVFAGVVLLALDFERLLQPLLDRGGMRGMSLRMTDLEQERLIFDSRPGSAAATTDFSVRHTLALGGRRWQLDFAGTPELLVTHHHRNSMLVALVGAFATLLFTGFVYHFATRRQRAEQRAAEMTAELRASQAELTRHRDHLSDLVAARTADLLAAKNSAERANRGKSEFLANMSHELRTPLHAILAFAHLGEDKLETVDEQKTRRYFSRIVEAGERLLALVGDLLDLSSIEAGKLRLDRQTVDLVVLLRDVAARFDSLMQQRGLQLYLPAADSRAMASVDPARFSQLLRNVLSNAIRFSPDGAVIRARIEATELSHGRRADDADKRVPAWRIVVIDEGIGIPEAELEAVFDSFVQSSKTRTGAGGTGLGLTICREIAAAHRGGISARNRPEGGAVFEILVPR